MFTVDCRGKVATVTMARGPPSCVPRVIRGTCDVLYISVSNPKQRTTTARTRLHFFRENSSAFFFPRRLASNCSSVQKAINKCVRLLRFEHELQPHSISEPQYWQQSFSEQ